MTGRNVTTHDLQVLQIVSIIPLTTTVGFRQAGTLTPKGTEPELRKEDGGPRCAWYKYG